MKKILFVISTLNTGGAQRALANMSLILEGKYEVTFLLNDAEGICYDYRGTIVDLGLKPQKDKTKLGYQLQVMLRRFMKLWRMKRSGEYVACISALTSANAANVLTRCKGCKTILSIRTFTSMDKLSPLKDAITAVAIRGLYNLADKVVVVSESSRQDLVRNFGVKFEKTAVIYNGYAADEIKKLAKFELTGNESEKLHKLMSYRKTEALESVSSDGHDVKKRDKTVVIVTAGRLNRAKGYWHLIRAMKKVVEKDARARLLILGEGEMHSYLQVLIDGLNLEEYVSLWGHEDNPYHIFDKCDMYVLSSIYEGFPNAMVEAMICGLPVIATDIESGPREILAPNTDSELSYKREEYSIMQYGILCGAFDGIQYDAMTALTESEIAMADAILEVINNEELRKSLKDKAMKRAKQFSVKETVAQWEELIG